MICDNRHNKSRFWNQMSLRNECYKHEQKLVIFYTIRSILYFAEYLFTKLNNKTYELQILFSYLLISEDLRLSTYHDMI